MRISLFLPSAFIFVLLWSCASPSGEKEVPQKDSGIPSSENTGAVEEYGQTPEIESQQQTTSRQLVIADITVGEKQLNLLVNTMSIATSQFGLMMNPDYKSLIEGLRGNNDPQTIEQTLQNQRDVFGPDMLKIKKILDSSFVVLSMEKPDVFRRFLKLESFQEGITLAERHQLPYGYPTFTSSLDDDEYLRYVVYMATLQPGAVPSPDDKVGLMWVDVTRWFQKFSAEIKSDPEFKAMMEPPAPQP